MKAKNEDTSDLTLLSNPIDLLDTVRTGRAITVPTKQLNIFYVRADAIEKAIKDLKGNCRPIIIGRRKEGTPSGDNLQHRDFVYETPQGTVRLTVQERQAWNPNPEKLEVLLMQKKLLDLAQTTKIDMEKVQGMCQAGMITPEEMASVSDSGEPTYALIAKFKP